jgi:hypothetical protein
MNYLLNARHVVTETMMNVLEEDNIVHIRCTCQSCKEKNTKPTTEENGIDISEQIRDKNVQVLESVHQPSSNTNQSIHSSQ